ncbi:MocR-like pyridoxine biosynthesis transcription factor PdxR [Neptunicoccus cionae]|uniref:GntR family transcriptional regulator n=1 Tax=Neptunicoccus cionae TaxID=2035344 RepID=A0A916QSN1_9RHOB|nr:PLP-dependent aminotransferase family protein [Amylibacter cionae]GGA08666.1 GntR family transcriptional regulator [Amylibacter cionae]
MALSEDLFFLDPAFEGSLQSQIRQIVASAILSRRFLPGERLPSSRKLAKHLGISRITVTLSYQELVADGYLATRSRSGYFVADDAPTSTFDGTTADRTDKVDWSTALQRRYTGAPMVAKSFNWQSYPYPFIYGQADPQLFSHSNWRLCAHQALGKKEFDSLTSDYAEEDDAQLIDFIARHTLTRRGIQANRDQILLTVGAQNALWMVGQLLLGKGRKAAFENPGYPGVRDILRHTDCALAPVDIDENGMIPDLVPLDTDVVFTTPSHHAPTAATMPMARRHALLELASAQDMIVVEDDYEFEMSFLNAPSPALKSLDTEGRVIYVGSFSKSLFPGLRLGYLVGSEPLIRQARALRTTVLRHPPGHMQRTTANFLALGHYDALIRRMKDAYFERRQVMAKALEEHELTVAGSASFGGSSFWMRAPDHVDTIDLARSLKAEGVLIEPGAPFFEGPDGPRNHYRLAYSSIDSRMIPKGISIISKTIRNF